MLEKIIIEDYEAKGSRIVLSEFENMQGFG